MNFILYSGLATKYNQISQNIDTTAHCPITCGKFNSLSTEFKLASINYYTIICI